MLTDLNELFSFDKICHVTVVVHSSAGEPAKRGVDEQTINLFFPSATSLRSTVLDE
jgi:hypothetical protein